jgi:glycosyltransferase involved in cell wall biosynthesis
MSWRFVLPSLKVSGGVREALRLAERLGANGENVDVLCMWSSPTPLATSLRVERLSSWAPRAARAIVDLPILAWRFRSRLRRARATPSRDFVFTHYATLPLAFCVPRGKRLAFVQDLEWRFVRQPLLSAVLRRLILFWYRRSTLISANAYLTRRLRALGLDVGYEIRIWADPRFQGVGTQPRDLDFLMVLRKGGHKRLDLYMKFIALARATRKVRLAVISPEDDIVASVRGQVDEAHCRPGLDEMRALYLRAKCFVHLSDHEGFGLPPLEAMGAGCVPLCRDSGGVRAYMEPRLVELILPLEMSVEHIFEEAMRLIGDHARLEMLGGVCREVFSDGLKAAAAEEGALVSLGAVRRLQGGVASRMSDQRQSL